MKTITSMVELKPFAAVFLDAVAWDSSLLPSLQKDFYVLSKLVNTRGLSVLMIDLPDAGKVVDQALSSGRLILGALPKTFGKRSWDKEFLLKCLFQKIFDEKGECRPNIDPNDVFFLRQILYLAKKVRKECSDAAVLSEVNAFKKTETETRLPSLDWEADGLLETSESLVRLQSLSFLDGYRMQPDWFSGRDSCPRRLLHLLSQIADWTTVHFGEFDWRTILPRHGPGAVADARTGTDKYLFPSWPRKLGQLFPIEYFAQSREDLHCEASRAYTLHEPSARLLAVPKTLKGPRLIASEPVAHQFIQQGLMKWLRDHLKRKNRKGEFLNPLAYSIDFTDQIPSQEAALAASRDGQSATVDLSSASDRLSCWVVERVFRRNPELLRALHACRTRTVVNGTGVGDKFYLRLRKFAAMGSAVTFPVQSIVYTVVAMAAIIFDNGWSVTRSNLVTAAGQIRVFGDDIVIPSPAVTSLALLLSYLGFRINMSKTHVRGYFRESCGMDAFRGHKVTPVYLRDLQLGTTSESLVSWIDVSNNAYYSGLWQLSEWMVGEVPLKVRKLIPTTNQSLAAVTLRTYQDGLRFLGRRRTSKSLHRPEVLALQAVNRTVRRRRDSYSSLLQYFLEKPSQEINWSSGWTVCNRLRLRKRWVPLYKVERTGVETPISSLRALDLCTVVVTDEEAFI